MWLTLIGGVVLAGIGFLADPAWPLTYLQSLGRYRDIPGVQTCGLCASLSVALVRVATGQSNTAQAAWVSLVLAVGTGGLLLWRFRTHLQDPAILTVLSALLTLLIDPYLLNYDYVLLLIPLFWLVRKSKLAILAYFIPWAALALGRDGNILLPVAALLLLTIAWKKRDELKLLPQ
jgi:O-antigen/teichoic acid export membrane protein